MIPLPLDLARHHAAALYEQIAAHLREGILQGSFSPGGKLPSESSLMSHFEVSRDTVRQALRRLAEEGLVESRQGKGTYARDRKLQVNLDALRGFYDSLVLQGVDPETRLLRWEPCHLPEAVQSRLDWDASEPAMALHRLYLNQGEPMALVTAYLPSAAHAVSHEQVESHPIYSILSHLLGWAVERAEMAITARQATDELSTLMGCAATAPLLVMERTSYLSDGTACEHTAFHIRPENYEFVVSSSGGLR